MSHDPLFEISIVQARNLLIRKEISCKQLVEYYLARIASMDLHTNSILEINPDAIEISEQLDSRFDELHHLPLYGIPILLKDNVYTHDEMHTSAGSLVLADWIAPHDAYVVEKLRNAGAVILGKANMTEWANFMSESMLSGYSSRGGQVKNPYGDFCVGGSSSGSGAAVAANFALVAIGSETSGSIIDPSVNNSIVGIKPTVGLVSRSGVIPLTITQDTLGPMTRSVRDAAILLDVISGEDPSDPYTSIADRPYRFTSMLDSARSRVFRVGVPSNLGHLEKEMLEQFHIAVDELEAAGVELVHGIEIAGLAENWDHEVLRHEFKKAINDFFATLPNSIPVRDLTSLIVYHNQHPELFLKYGQNLLEWTDETSGSLEDPTYVERKAYNIKHAKELAIDSTLSAYKLDAIVYPETVGSDLAARAGYPLVTVPAGYYASGGPFGITFSGTACSETILIQIAYLYETHTQHRKPPIFDR
ncbi:MAG: amidase [Cohnella sp.]|nr:amidase [Cohnella sp.]